MSALPLPSTPGGLVQTFIWLPDGTSEAIRIMWKVRKFDQAQWPDLLEEMLPLRGARLQQQQLLLWACALQPQTSLSGLLVVGWGS